MTKVNINYPSRGINIIFDAHASTQGVHTRILFAALFVYMYVSIALLIAIGFTVYSAPPMGCMRTLPLPYADRSSGECCGRTNTITNAPPSGSGRTATCLGRAAPRIPHRARAVLQREQHHLERLRRHQVGHQRAVRQHFGREAVHQLGWQYSLCVTILHTCLRCVCCRHLLAAFLTKPSVLTLLIATCSSYAPSTTTSTRILCSEWVHTVPSP